jgi:hypothetical protein
MITVVFEWRDNKMVPLQRFHNTCLAQFEEGGRYPLVPQLSRSRRSHNHYFAAVEDAFNNLPGDDERWPSAEHLRKWCLIKAGYRDERAHPCASRAEALKLRAFIRPLDDFAVIAVHENVVIVMTAQSQSVKAMGRERFQKSKQDVLNICADLIGVEPQALSSNAGQAA